MSKVVPSKPDEDLGGFGIPPEGNFVAALQAPIETGVDEVEQARREKMDEAELRKVPVKGIVLSASISRGDESGGRASLFCGLTRSKGQMNFLRFIAGTGLAPALEKKYPDLGPIEEGWDDSIITSRKFFNELCTMFPGVEVNIEVKHSRDGQYANIARVTPISSVGQGDPQQSSSGDKVGW